MQYSCSLNRSQLIDLAINQYFYHVDNKNLDKVMECFHENAMLCVQRTSWSIFAGKKNIKKLYIDINREYDVIVHRDFTCTVDEQNGRIAASFITEVANNRGDKSFMETTNFWRVRDNKFQEVYVYQSAENPLHLS